MDEVENESAAQNPQTIGNSPPRGDFVILGDPFVGETIIARPNGIRDDDGIEFSTAAFQWLRNGVEIQGATEQTYVVSQDDVDSSLTVRYTYTDLAGTSETVVSTEKLASSIEDLEEDQTDVASDDDGQDAPEEAPEDVPPEVEEPEERNTTTDGVNDTPVKVTPFADVFTVRAGMDFIDGLDGLDTAVFSGDLSHYTITQTVNTAFVTDQRADGYGLVTLANVEFIRFEFADSGGTDFIDLRGFGDVTDEDSSDSGQARQAPVEAPDFSLSVEDAEELIEMYIAYFNRAPDAVGFAFWGEVYSDGASIEDIAELFVDQPETRALYPEDQNPAKLVSDVYDNVLGRAPDLEGMLFWTKALRSGEVGADELILEVLRGVEAGPDAGAAQAFVDRQIADQQYLDMKTDLGLQYAVEHGLSNVEDAAGVLAMFDGSVESFAAASAAIDALYAEAIQPRSGETVMPLVGMIDGFDLI